MRELFNDGWVFSEYEISDDLMFKDDKPILLTPDEFLEQSKIQTYKSVNLPHDWMIYHVKDLYRNSVGFYKKTFKLTEEQIKDRHNAIRFEGIYMNSGVWINGEKAGEWKYGYTTFEFDISDFVTKGQNDILVIVVYQNPNTRWYSGAGIIRDVIYINLPNTYIVSDGIYFSSFPENFKKLDGKWIIRISSEIAGESTGCTIIHSIISKDGKIFAQFEKDGEDYTVEAPHLWDTNDPYFYYLKTVLKDKNGNILDQICQHCGFKYAVFTSNEGFFLNGRHLKIKGACHHHDHGALGAAFDKEAQRRQFYKLKLMGVNSVRCSHNPPPTGWMDLCDEMGIMVDNESFDMWEKKKNKFDYSNYFNDWYERDTINWVRHDRNHPSLIMWSIGNEIYDTHMGNGLEITQKLYDLIIKNDSNRNAFITIGSSYMTTEGGQECAKYLDTIGYNYSEKLYNEHHEKYPDWKIYGSETSSTIQSRGIYHFPESLYLMTFSDGQCSCLGNCTTSWGCINTQTVISNDRDCPFSSGQYIWTGWDYIGEPTPYHSKSSFFGQIDTAGFPKDTFYLYKSEWALKDTDPFVHILPYWDWNEGQLIDIKVYTNMDSVELFFNDISQGKQEINHKDGKQPYGYWKIEYHKGEIRAVAYDSEGNIVAEEIKKSFNDPDKIILKPEKEKYGNLFFIQIMTCDKDGILVENARNYITFCVKGDAELVGMDNGDSTDYEEYKPSDGKIHTRKLFSNRLIAIIRANSENSSFEITAASKDLPNISLRYENKIWSGISPDDKIIAEKDFIPSRKIELLADGSTKLDKNNLKINVTAKIFPKNSTLKAINWKPVLKECISSDLISVIDSESSLKENEFQIKIIKAEGDGECLLRCTATNGSDYDEVISDLPFTITGLGTKNLNPYNLIEAIRFTNWEQDKDKPEITIESGISTRNNFPVWISFDRVDFGLDGGDTIHIPIFSGKTELQIEIYEGNGIKGECLGKFTYMHKSIYNVYSENIFTINRRLFGIHTITINLLENLFFHGFYFDKTPKAFAKLRALDANIIAGDSFIKTDEAVEGIGNNVNLDFENMNFGEQPATSIIICGKSNIDNNTINLKFYDSKNNTTTEIIEFAHTNDYEEKIFDIKPVNGDKKVRFVFLPGCNFDFKWFKFE